MQCFLRETCENPIQRWAYVVAALTLGLLPACGDPQPFSVLDASADAGVVVTLPPPVEVTHDASVETESSDSVVDEDPTQLGGTANSACGNGVLDSEAGEQCDDGNNSEGDGCGSFCLLEPACGNGVVEPEEQCDPPGTPQCDAHCVLIVEESVCGDSIVEGFEYCDDGNDVDHDGCSRFCTSSPGCGNGTVELGEDCEPPGASGCDEACHRPAPPECGNGQVEEYWTVLFGAPALVVEECDDANSEDGDGCGADCLITALPGCPDGNVDSGEACDDGNFFNGDGCNTQCQLETPGCPNGVVEGDEECDDGNFFNGDGCSTHCVVDGAEPVCGDGSRDSGEECDDANLEDGDGCSSSCVLEIDIPDPPGSTHLCGNGTLDGAEECDDGNRLNGDGCSALCELRYCGDGIVNRSETCDDGVNTTVYTVAGTGCGRLCRLPGFCGDGIRQFAHERCDDGNTVAGDGCDALCARESTCGNGVIEFDEQCDDGNVLAGDNCSENCVVEPPPDCGDGVFDLADGEECDDHNFIPGDGCSPACRLEVCDNAILDPGEECEHNLAEADAGAGDGGATLDGGVAAACSPSCQFELSCGDGVLSPGEECDDENTEDGDGCSAVCLIEGSCGDGWLDLAEECDDQNIVAADGCSIDCKDEAACGDGNLDPGEACDDGNVHNGDACSSRCHLVASSVEATGVKNPHFDTNSLFWFGSDRNVVVSHNSQDAGGSTSSGSLAVMFNLQSESGILSTAGGQQCVASTPGQEHDLFVKALIGTTQPPSTRAGLLVRFFPSADCSGAALNVPPPALSTTADRGVWVRIGGQFEVPAGAFSVQLRLRVTKAQNEPPAVVLFDDVEFSEVGGEGPSEPHCGDSLVNVGGETCDDGNTVNADGCDSACHDEPVCGDGLLATTEFCDDGNVENQDGCSVLCFSEPRCGNGTLEAPEVCDDDNPDSGDGCSRLCQEEFVCGDGDKKDDEQCDDGNILSGDGCSSRCGIEPVCGNSTLESREDCDDGNLLSDDGCSQLCATEAAGTSCGDGIIQASLGEVCEYTPGTAARYSLTCRPDCTPSCYACQRTECAVEVAACSEATGLAEAGPRVGERKAVLCQELYDCMHEVGDCQEGTPAVWSPEKCLCGSLTSANDYPECLAGNLGGGLCEAQMAAAAETTNRSLIIERIYEPDFVVGAAFDLAACGEACEAACVVSCGNGVREGSEECDDGNAVDDDGCAACEITGCGNSRVEASEQCDPPEAGVCNADCTLAQGCGDGVLNGHLLGDANLDAGASFPEEECDDGNRKSGDGCSDLCEEEFCGDLVIQPNVPGHPEECDGAPVNGIACTADCKLEFNCEQCMEARCAEGLEALTTCVPQECTAMDAMIECMETSNCISGGWSGGVTDVPCLCGPAAAGDPLGCFGGELDGPCKPEILAAMLTSNSGNALLRWVDSAYPGGRVNVLYFNCQFNNCAEECGP